MTEPAASHAADIAAVASGIGDLHDLFRDCIRAYAPPNVQFERERIIAQCANPREWAFVLGFLSEGENECALLLDLICAAIADDPRAATTHLVDEAWYYVRTSIDSAWQLDDGAPSAAAALKYLQTVVCQRLALVRAEPPREAVAAAANLAGANLLRELRDESAVGMTR